MKKIFLTAATFVVFIGQIFGQTTTTTRSQRSDGRMETITRTETVQTDGQILTTTTQTITAAASFGVKASANLSDFLIRDMDNIQTNMKLGASADIFLKVESGNFAFQWEWSFFRKACEIENNNDKSRFDYEFLGAKTTWFFMGQINTSSGKIFIGAGPYVGFGIDGVQKPANIDLYKKNKETVKSIMQRWDVGLSPILGYEFNNGLIISGSYQAGFINQMSAEKDNMSMKCRMFSLGIGYKF